MRAQPGKGDTHKDHFGQRMQTARIAKGWSREQFAELYSKALRKKDPLSIDAIEALERSASGPVNPNRRAIIALLLDIPFVAIGMQATSTPNTPSIIKRDRLDPKESRSALNKYWEQHLTSTSVHLIDEIEDNMQSIRNQIPYVGSTDQRELQTLLYDYHIVLACIKDSQCKYNSATSQLNQAMILAKKLRNPELQAAALYRKGNILFDVGKVETALDAYTIAGSLGKQFSANDGTLIGAIQLKQGLAKSFIAGKNSSTFERLSLLENIDNVGKIADLKKEDAHFLKLNMERYHLDKAAAFINLGYYQDAIDELSLVPKTSSSACRSAYSDILLAKAHMGQGHYPTATMSLLSAVDVMKKIHSRVNIRRIAEAYRSLKTSSYSSSTEVAELGLELWEYDPKLVTTS